MAFSLHGCMHIGPPFWSVTGVLGPFSLPQVTAKVKKTIQCKHLLFRDPSREKETTVADETKNRDNVDCEYMDEVNTWKNNRLSLRYLVRQKTHPKCRFPAKFSPRTTFWTSLIPLICRLGTQNVDSLSWKLKRQLSTWPRDTSTEINGKKCFLVWIKPYKSLLNHRKPHFCAQATHHLDRKNQNKFIVLDHGYHQNFSLRGNALSAAHGAVLGLTVSTWKAQMWKAQGLLRRKKRWQLVLLDTGEKKGCQEGRREIRSKKKLESEGEKSAEEDDPHLFKNSALVSIFQQQDWNIFIGKKYL